MVVPLFFFWKASIASCWKASWKVEPLPWRVPETLAVVVAAPPPAAVAPVVPALLLLELSDPQAAPTRARASTPATAAVPRRLVMFTRWSPLFVNPPSTLRRAGELALGHR